MNLVKILFYAVVLLTAPIPISGFLSTCYSAFDVDFEEELMILDRDNVNDTIREYEIKIDTLNAMLLILKRDEEWLDLKLLHIQEQDRIIPQVLVESRQKMIEKKLFLHKKKKRLIELIEQHGRMIKKLDGRIKAKSVQIEELSEKDLSEIDEIQPDKIYSSSNIEKELKDKINTMGIQDWVELINDGAGIRLEVRLPILFASGKSTTSDSYKTFLKKLAKFTEPYDVLVHVKGFTDKLKFKQMSNIELGAKRAAKIVNLLVKYGM